MEGGEGKKEMGKTCLLLKNIQWKEGYCAPSPLIVPRLYVSGRG